MRKLTFVALLSMSSLFGFNHICPGDFTVEGDYLYLKPDIGHTYFAASDTTVITAGNVSYYLPSGSYVSCDPDFTSAFRVGVYYGLCECPIEIRGFYTRLNSNYTNSANSEEGQAPFPLFDAALRSPFVTSASSITDLTFQRGDIIGAHNVFSNWCGSWINVFGGFQILDISLKQIQGIESLRNSVLNFNNNASNLEVFGIGPEIGFESKYTPCWLGVCERFIPQCLSFVSKGSFSLMALRNEINSLQNGILGNSSSPPQATPYSINGPRKGSNWRGIWSAYAQLGVSVEKRISCVKTAWEIGYEFDFYNQALTRIVNTAPFTRPDFSLQGLYVSGKFSF
jgi:hypothetical protein